MADETTDTTSTDTTTTTTDTTTTNLLATAVTARLTAIGIDATAVTLNFDDVVYQQGAIVQGTITAYADSVRDFTDEIIAAQTASELEVTTGYTAKVHAIGDKKYYADRSVFVYYYEIEKIEEE